MDLDDSVVPELVQSKVMSYASTDEDVDELNSHYSDVLDRSTSAIQNIREKFHLDSIVDFHRNAISRPRMFSTEYSQVTMDSGVDILSEQKLYQPNQTFTIDEQSSEETTDQNDLFALSDDSVIDMQSKSTRNVFLGHPHELSTSLQESYFSAKSDLNTDKDPYAGYELETITDEEEDQPQATSSESNELIITSESSPPAPTSITIPPQFEFKLPSFGEWIDRVFTTFLTETNQQQSPSIASSRSSSINSIHNSSQSTINSSSSQMITVIENPNFRNLAQSSLHSEEEQKNDDDAEHSLHGKQKNHLYG